MATVGERHAMTPVGAGIVGAGNYGKYRRDRMRETGLFRLLACFDINPAAMAAAQREDGCVPVESFDALLDFPGIEAVVISTGASSHAEYAIRAAERGKHVFVEKPLCCDPGELEALLTAGERAGVAMGMGHTPLDGAADRLLAQYLAEGRLGTVTAIEMTTCHGGGWQPSAWRFLPERNPGGMLFHCGVHHIAWLQHFFGRVTEVAAMMRGDVNPNTPTADAATVLLRLESGLLATLHAYHVTAYHHYKYLYGTLGNLYIHEFPTEVAFQARSPEGKPEPKVRLADDDFPAGKEDLTGNLESWARAIRGQGVPTPSIYDGAATVAVVFAADEAARTGRVTAVPDYTARSRAPAS